MTYLHVVFILYTCSMFHEEQILVTSNQENKHIHYKDTVSVKTKTIIRYLCLLVTSICSSWNMLHVYNIKTTCRYVMYYLFATQKVFRNNCSCEVQPFTDPPTNCTHYLSLWIDVLWCPLRFPHNRCLVRLYLHLFVGAYVLFTLFVFVYV
jgi:hypothetical protein